MKKLNAEISTRWDGNMDGMEQYKKYFFVKQEWCEWREQYVHIIQLDNFIHDTCMWSTPLEYLQKEILKQWDTISKRLEPVRPYLKDLDISLDYNGYGGTGVVFEFSLYKKYSGKYEEVYDAIIDLQFGEVLMDAVETIYLTTSDHIFDSIDFNDESDTDENWKEQLVMCMQDQKAACKEIGIKPMRQYELIDTFKHVVAIKTLKELYKNI